MNKFLKKSALLLLVMAGFACSAPKQDDSASTEENTDTPEMTAGLADGTYALAAGQSLGWEGSKVAYSHNGIITISEGTFMVNGGNITGGSFTVDMTTITNEDVEDAEQKQKLVGHLMSDDFFGVETYPTASFTITNVAPAEGNATHNITGNLELRGISNEISFPATVSAEGDMVMVKGEATIDRSKWEVKFNSPDFPDFANLAADKIISNDMKITMDLKASKQEATM